MSELLFECYHVPHIAYGVDALYSFYNNNPSFNNQSDGLVVSCGYQSTEILPILNGRIDSANCRRCNFGGAQLDWFMQRLLQLKYPGHLTAITLSRAEVFISFIILSRAEVFISFIILMAHIRHILRKLTRRKLSIKVK